ncbi:glycosyltransferase [Actibacterium sp. 188UL27-1]|uniref:glycosyltransferase n=1 Tax=Actibacterium sp. 188UL27-1 TaxID=2786961 RepID=UPI0019581DFF|nr:glycosyltransferase [Actibacterium sp. 188UL27-1]MBM7069082.1 glycosyltransferase [Actibacterium sp. 188UL27-1]
MSGVDILLVADPRFSGGSSTALITDAEAFVNLGMTVGLMLVTSSFFTDPTDGANPKVLALLDQPGVTPIKSESAITAKTAFFHHPLPFYHGLPEQARVSADQVVLVVHHPPFRGDGSMEYNPVQTQTTIARQFGHRPLWSPVSGAIRSQLRSFAPFIRLTNADWVNAFDVGGWTPSRTIFQDNLATVGRHGRPDPLKWPDRATDIDASLNLGDGWQTRIMGCPNDLISGQDSPSADWEVLGFNAEPVDHFLNTLDLFSYFYSDLWFEAFGRTVTEAMLMERPCVLDTRLRDTFGDLAQYCTPDEVAAVANRLRENPTETRNRATRVKAQIVTRYGTQAIADRLLALGTDHGTVSRNGATFATPMQTIRKGIGLMRRRRAGIER